MEEVQVDKTQVQEEKVEQKPLTQRVAEFQEEKTEQPVEDKFTTFDVKKIAEIEDPEQRKNLMAAYHQMQSDYTKKTQEIAKIRNQPKQPDSQPWSPERVKKLLDDPTFVKAAQSVANVEEDFSSLSEEEKAKIKALEDQNKMVLNEMNRLNKQKQDDYLKQKYPDYAPDMVDTTISKLVNGEINADTSKCWGCGVCTTTCPVEVLSLEK